MMKWVRLTNNVIHEIIPEAATLPSVAHWYGEEFAAQCLGAPDEVEQGWFYADGTWSAMQEMTEEEKRVSYEALTVQYIRKQYSVDDENKIIREYLAGVEGAQERFTAYHTDVENCKTCAHTEIYGN